jgi:hypothetical protein
MDRAQRLRTDCLVLLRGRHAWTACVTFDRPRSLPPRPTFSTARGMMPRPLGESEPWAGKAMRCDGVSARPHISRRYVRLHPSCILAARLAVHCLCWCHLKDLAKCETCAVAPSWCASSPAIHPAVLCCPIMLCCVGNYNSSQLYRRSHRHSVRLARARLAVGEDAHLCGHVTRHTPCGVRFTPHGGGRSVALRSLHSMRLHRPISA